ncbi:MAG: pyroglutamyl-peptidase I [Candidatus Methanofastidiosia archaeon]|jgi:pyroglutamyl-peptidase
MTVLVTGFEPFKKEKVNPSWEVCKRLSEMDMPDIRVCQLPVVFDEAKTIVLDSFQKVTPDVVIHLGEAGGRTHITVERIAINCDSAPIEDNKGQKRENLYIEPEGHDGYFASIPVVDIVNALKKAHIPAAISNSAGTYLCNHVLYGTLHYVKIHNLSTKAGFIHVPYLPQQTVDKPGKASMCLDTMVQGILIAIDVCTAH